MSIINLGSLHLGSPCVMGVLNVTTDSFSDGGKFVGGNAALAQALAMTSAGAEIIDVGGESTRPGAADVSEQEEIERVIPVIEAIRAEVDIPISIDTSKPGVMRAAVSAGADILNDVRALQEEGALQAATDLGRPVCLMHMQGAPRTMQEQPTYNDVVAEVTEFLRNRAAACIDAGMPRSHILVDPGFGFGKSPTHNIELLAGLEQLNELGFPVLVGLSRKSTLGQITGRDVGERLPASLAAATIAVLNGAHIVRAHDVAETVDAVKIAVAVANGDVRR